MKHCVVVLQNIGGIWVTLCTIEMQITEGGSTHEEIVTEILNFIYDSKKVKMSDSSDVIPNWGGVIFFPEDGPIRCEYKAIP